MGLNGLAQLNPFIKWGLTKIIGYPIKTIYINYLY